MALLFVPPASQAVSKRPSGNGRNSAHPERCSRSAAVSAAHTVQTGRAGIVFRSSNRSRNREANARVKMPTQTFHAASRRDGGGPPTAWFRLNAKNPNGAQLGRLVAAIGHGCVSVFCKRLGNLISTRLQPGGLMATKTQPLQRFRGCGKPLKRLPGAAVPDTRLKRGANERGRAWNEV